MLRQADNDYTHEGRRRSRGASQCGKVRQVTFRKEYCDG
jgi:hypothetical protein